MNRTQVVIVVSIIVAILFGTAFMVMNHERTRYNVEMSFLDKLTLIRNLNVDSGNKRVTVIVSFEDGYDDARLRQIANIYAKYILESPDQEYTVEPRAAIGLYLPAVEQHFRDIVKEALVDTSVVKLDGDVAEDRR